MFIGPRTYVPTPYEHMWKAPRTYVPENAVLQRNFTTIKCSNCALTRKKYFLRQSAIFFLVKE